MKVPGSFRKYGDFKGEAGLAHVKLSQANGKTAISHLRTKAPLLVQRALYPDGTGMAHVYLMSSAGGILQGDRLEIEIEAGDCTQSRITTQAATKIYKMDKGYAAQAVSISARSNSYVEFLPYQLIPFKSSRFCQDVRIQVAPGSTVVYSETVCAGRTASGEAFDFDVCFLRMAARDHNDGVLFTDTCNIEPASSKQFNLVFGGKTIWSTTYIITAEHEEIGREINAAIKDRSILAGCSALPRDCGLVVRALDDSIDKVADLTCAVAGIARRHAQS